MHIECIWLSTDHGWNSHSAGQSNCNVIRKNAHLRCDTMKCRTSIKELEMYSGLCHKLSIRKELSTRIGSKILKNAAFFKTSHVFNYEFRFSSRSKHMRMLRYQKQKHIKIFIFCAVKEQCVQWKCTSSEWRFRFKHFWSSICVHFYNRIIIMCPLGK